MSRPILRAVLLFCCLFLLNATCSAQEDFDARSNEGLTRNPAGVKFLLRTESQNLTFHLYETIPIRLEFSSVRPLKYSIENEVMNYATQTQVEVEPGNAVSLTLDQGRITDSSSIPQIGITFRSNKSCSSAS